MNKSKYFVFIAAVKTLTSILEKYKPFLYFGGLSNKDLSED